MRFNNAVPLSLVAVFALALPMGARAADPPANRAPIALSQPEPSMIRISGVSPGAHQLMALLYANFAPDMPTVFLSRRPLATDVAGRFDAIVPIAPAYLPGAIVTVIVQTSAAVLIARGSLIITNPNVFLPVQR